MKIDLLVAQLLCSRLCHDLIGPAGAVGAGTELMEEGGAEAAEALDLTIRGARNINAGLAFYRAAFGHGGAAEGSGALKGARTLCDAYLAGRSTTLGWRDEDLSEAPSPLACKLLLNMVLLAESCLHKGGSIDVQATALADGIGIAVTARGERAHLRAELRTAAEGGAQADSLTPHTVQACLTGLLADGLNADLEFVDMQGGEVRITALVPPQGSVQGSVQGSAPT